ncbi:MAG: DUF2341 domain-containing protein, partial [Planctomycetota bacterium]
VVAEKPLPERDSGDMYIITTPEGAGLPATALERDFPLLVRLHRDFFDFSRAGADGKNIRFTSSDGTPLRHKIEEWDPAGGSAVIWVRLPVIRGNARQKVTLHWGKRDAASASDGGAVFDESNGYLSVWHMSDPVEDVVGTLESKDKGTTPAAGIIGPARRFTRGKGIFCGEDIMTFPTGCQPHSTEAWFRGEKQNCRVLSWGKEYRQGKVQMWYRSPSHIRMDCYFSDADVRGNPTIPLGKWTHVIHTYQKGISRIYVNGALDKEARTRATTLNIQRPARMWIGGWYGRYDFVGDIDEVRISKVVRSPDWIKLCYENQKPLQTLVGPVVQQGNDFSVSQGAVAVSEGKSVTVTGSAGGAQKVYWILRDGGREEVVAVDRLAYTFNAGRVTKDKEVVLRLRGIYEDEVKTKDINIRIREDIPEPVFTLEAPARWDGRETVELSPAISNLNEMRAKGAGDVSCSWRVSGLATVRKVEPGKLVLMRAQNSGRVTVTLAVDNGGAATTRTATIAVTEPARDAWVHRAPAPDEMPTDNQFYARDDSNTGKLHCNGTLERPADSLFLKLYADGRLIKTLKQQPKTDRKFAFAAKLKPGLIKYKVELGSRTGGVEAILHAAGNIVCGDAYIIDGQSNALATDTREQSPRETHEWVRSYSRPRHYRKGKAQNLWCYPVWKAQREHKAELGWWGMELAKRLVASQKVPIFIVNAAVGGTRIDQHQRNEADPTDLKTIYGRMLWRVREARLTHGIRAILWHQGENDQGAAGPDGGYGWETYQRYFIEMSAAWKRDFPNVRRYYVFQIWPNSCSMGGGNGDMLREKQRTLPRLYSNMDIISTLGIKPPGPAHFPLAGWGEFARLIQPLIERDFYGRAITDPISAPNLERARYTGNAKDAIALEFDQPVVWRDSLVGEFYLDGARGQVASGVASGNMLTLKLKAPSVARKITYLKEMSWSQERLLIGRNGIAALTFCDVPVEDHGRPREQRTGRADR